MGESLNNSEMKKIAAELAKKLAEAGYVNLVEGEFEMKSLLESSKYNELLRVGGLIKPIDVVAIKNGELNDYPEYNRDSFKGVKNYAEKLLKEEAKSVGANYLFIRTSLHISKGKYETFYGYRVSATPYIILSHFEEDHLKQSYVGAGLPKEMLQKVKDCFGMDLSIDFQKMYRDAPDEFMKRFAAASDKGKEQMLEEVVKLDKRNEELDMELSTKYPEVSKRIARNSVGGA